MVLHDFHLELCSKLWILKISPREVDRVVVAGLQHVDQPQYTIKLHPKQLILNLAISPTKPKQTGSVFCIKLYILTCQSGHVLLGRVCEQHPYS